MTVFPWQLQSWLRLLVQEREPREQEEQEQWQKPMHKQKKLPGEINEYVLWADRYYKVDKDTL